MSLALSAQSISRATILPRSPVHGEVVILLERALQVLTTIESSFNRVEARLLRCNERCSMLRSTKGSAETILVVDDDALVLRIVVKVLEAANFRVYSAASGPSAVKLASETTETIDLLLSDVEMPEMSGPALGEALKVARPNIHVMLMSGAANGNLLILNYGWAYVQKPFVAVKLVQMVNDVLHSKNRSQLGGYEFDSRKDRNDSVE
jgi:CheY-like chemotaxis protein